MAAYDPHRRNCSKRKNTKFLFNYLICLAICGASIIVTIPGIESKPILSEIFEHFFGENSPSRNRQLSSSSSSSSISSSGEINFNVPDSSSVHTYSSSSSDRNSPRIWLTVSSIVSAPPSGDRRNEFGNSTPVIRAVELHWHPAAGGPAIGDHLELYRIGDDAQPIKRYLLRDSNNHTSPRYIKTDIEFPHLNRSQLDTLIQRTDLTSTITTSAYGPISGRCLHFYLVYLTRSTDADPKPLAINCVHIDPRWMERDFAILRNRTLADIVIPGAHDATSYQRYNWSDYENNVITRFQYTQDENLYAQLAYGIRYLDMRVGAYNITEYRTATTSRNQQSMSSSNVHHHHDHGDSESHFYREELWMVHDISRNHISLREALKQVKRFLERTTHEIVIVDFHRFVNGFLDVDDFALLQSRLRNFYKVVVEQLGPFLIPYSSNTRATIGEMVRDGKRVILGYAYKFNDRGLLDTDQYWPAVQHLWANTDDLSRLESYMRDHICRSAPPSRIELRSMMAQFTPSIEGIIFQRYHGLRELAAAVNRRFDRWFRRRYAKCLNIVSGDFFLGSELVQIAIDVNRRRFGNSG